MKITDGKQDTSEEMIVMLTKADEIQKHAPTAGFDDGRFRFKRLEDNLFVRVGGHCNNEAFFEDYKLIWMPNQYQYQYMLEMSMYKLAMNIRGYYDGLSGGNELQGDWMPQSMDQLLCYMVMGSRHNKCWNGKEYEKEVLT